MDASWLEQIDDEQVRCEACLMRPALGMFTLHDEDGHHVTSWWTCIQCAEHDAPIHDARGLVVAVVITEACL